MAVNTVNNFQVPFADPDLEGMTVSLASTAQSGLNDNAPTGVGVGATDLTVSSTGLITWDTTGTSVGQKYALQLRVDENDSANSVPVDFIIEITDSAGTQNGPPSVDGASFTLEVGDVLAHTVTGSDDGNPNPPGSLTWDPINNITGPQTVSNATFDVNTQLLSWDTTGFAIGTYTFFISNSDSDLGGFGQIIVNLTAAQVSEPGMALVMGLGLAGIAYTRRRKIA